MTYELSEIRVYEAPDLPPVSKETPDDAIAMMFGALACEEEEEAEEEFDIAALQDRDGFELEEAALPQQAGSEPAAESPELAAQDNAGSKPSPNPSPFLIGKKEVRPKRNKLKKAAYSSQFWAARAEADLFISTEGSQEKATKLIQLGRERLGTSQERLESIQSYYWWEGEVQCDTEHRVTLHGPPHHGRAHVVQELTRIHSYEVPMILHCDPQQGFGQCRYWRAELEIEDENVGNALAAMFVQTRAAACAQMSSATDEGHAILSIKTVNGLREIINRAAASLFLRFHWHWTPVDGNLDYLQWVDESCQGCTLQENADPFEHVVNHHKPPHAAGNRVV